MKETDCILVFPRKSEFSICILVAFGHVAYHKTPQPKPILPFSEMTSFPGKKRKDLKTQGDISLMSFREGNLYISCISCLPRPLPSFSPFPSLLLTKKTCYFEGRDTTVETLAYLYPHCQRVSQPPFTFSETQSCEVANSQSALRSSPKLSGRRDGREVEKKRKGTTQ